MQFLIKLLLTSWHYSGFGIKLSPIFGFAKSSQIQNHFSIKPNAQIRCSGCYAFGFLFIPIFGFASAPLLSRKHFKLIIMFKDFIYLFQNFDELKEYPFFGLKLKYAVWIIPIPFFLYFVLGVLYLLKALNYL